MLGSIIGDIVGSVYERRNMKTKDFQLFSPRGHFTDDSVMSIATADWLLHGGECASYYAKWGNCYPRVGYGRAFREWLWKKKHGEVALPYNSCGNGSAMRVGPVGWAFQTKEETLEAARQSAECTHNHPEGVKGAQVVALCVFMARQGRNKEEIRTAVEEEFGYDLSFTIDEIRNEYGWESRFGYGALCQASVPQAVVAFLDGTDFEDCIRNAVSLGGDSDTIACITGSIAEAFYGIPEAIYKEAWTYLPNDFKLIINKFEKYFVL